MLDLITIELIFFIAGLFFSGLRAIVGKSMVYFVWKVLRKYLLKTEHDLALYFHTRNKAMRFKK